MKKILIILGFIFILAILHGTIHKIEITLSNIEIEAKSDENGLCKFIGEDFQHLSRTGEPDLPYIAVHILLPPDADLNTISVHVNNTKWSNLSGKWNVKPAAPFATWDGTKEIVMWPENVQIENGRDIAVYQNDEYFPNIENVRFDEIVVRQWKMIQVFYPVYRYNPVESSLTKFQNGELKVQFEKELSHNFSASNNPIGIEIIRRHAVNFDDAIGEYGESETREPGMYLIITTDALQNQSQQLNNFVLHKESLGFIVQVETVENMGGGIGDDVAENMRIWLQANYLNLEIEYVLLIGNPDPTNGTVPMKMTCPIRSDNTFYYCPTDFYYAELTSTDWDMDGDGFFGEFFDDFGGSPDRGAEVAVGRIPFYESTDSIDDLDNILTKIMNYENTYEADAVWRKKVLLAMYPSNEMALGYPLGEQIKDEILNPMSWNYHRVYYRDFGLNPAPESYPCNYDNVTNAWNNSEFGFALYWTHGSSDHASNVIDLAHAALLNDNNPSFLFQCACNNGDPEDNSNLGYTLLKNGCVNIVSPSSATRFSLGLTDGLADFSNSFSNSGIAFGYSNKITTNEMKSGDAMNDIGISLGIFGNFQWDNLLSFNIYGCPATGLNSFQESITGESDIVSNDNECLDIPYMDYQNISISSVTEALKVWSFTLRDGGNANNDTDALPTDVRSLSISKGASDTITDWGLTIRRAAIFRNIDNSLIADIDVTDANRFDFTNLTTLIAPDDASEVFDLYLTFEDNVKDGSQFQFQISSLNSVPNASGSSGFTLFETNSSTSASMNSLIVSATNYTFLYIPELVSIDHNFSIEIAATDSLGSVDDDYIGFITLSLYSGSGNLYSDQGLTREISNGICLINNLYYDGNDSFSILVSGDLFQSISSSITSAQPIFVDADATGINNGDSWEDAYIDFQDALEIAVSGNEIWIAEGTYKPSTSHHSVNDRYNYFCLVNGISVYGGFNGTENAREQRDYTIYETIFSGDIGIENEISDNCYHVFYHQFNLINLDSTTVLDGCTITQGNADSSYDWHNSGGGMRNSSSSPTIRNCRFVDNYAEWGAALSNTISSSSIVNCVFENNIAGELGGAIHLKYCPDIIIESSLFDNNNSGSSGGAIANELSYLTIRNSNFENNSAEYSGGALYHRSISGDSSTEIENCDFNNNLAFSGGAIGAFLSRFVISYSNFYFNSATNGGGIYHNGAVSSILNCSFIGNSATEKGGGLYNIYSNEEGVSFIKNSNFTNNISDEGAGIFIQQADSLIVANCIISNNTANANGGGIYTYNCTPIITNSIVDNNSALNDGGGIYNYGSYSDIANCTITGNSAGNQGGGLFNQSYPPSVCNSIFWGNSASSGNEIFNSNTGINITYSDVEGGFTGTGNIDADPMFINIVNGDYHIDFTSPCINAGTPDTTGLNIPDYDIEGNPRIFDGEVYIIDMGAYEFQGEPLQADFSADIILGNAPLNVEFTVTSNYPADDYEWDFDNDEVIDAAGENVSWVFPVGIYTVTLNATYGLEVITIEKENYITSLNSPPFVENPVTAVSFYEDTSDSSLDLNNIFSDENGDSLSFTYSGNDSIIVEIQEDGIVLLSGGLNWYGSKVITFTADDGYIERGNDLVSKRQMQDFSRSKVNAFSKAKESISGRVAASLDIEISIEPINDPPILTITGNFEADEDLPSESYEFSSFCSQVWGENDTLTLSEEGSEHIDVIVTGFSVIFQSNTDNWSGTEEVTFYLDDNTRESIVRNGRAVSKRQNQREVVSQVIPVTIYPVNDAPTIELPDSFTF
ncbi:MAG: C25 family peptidase propeptide domain-containing protein [Candidatus Tenebribacter mawsonii]|nr:C25 family peptidase propeptide domain-containing protein [Candidatus Tenebribacter mawsonii]